MPPLPPVPGVLKAQLKWTNTNAPPAWSHLYWHTTTSSVTYAQAQAMASQIVSSWNTNMRSMQNHVWTLSQVMVTDLGPTPDLPGLATGTTAGQLTLTPLTAETCALVNIIIGRRYKGGHPRLYLPLGDSTTLADPTHWTTSWLGTFGSNWSNFINNIVTGMTGGPTLDYSCSVSYHSGHALRPTPQVDKVLSWVLNPIPGSQRRRMGR